MGLIRRCEICLREQLSLTGGVCDRCMAKRERQRRNADPRNGTQVGGCYIGIRAVIRNQHSLDQIHEALESLRELHDDAPWLDLGQIAEQLSQALQEVEYDAA